MKVRGSAFLFIAFLFLTPSLTTAQSSASYSIVDQDAFVTITASPEHPVPGDTIRLQLRVGSLVDIQDSTIVWYRNNKVIAKGVGKSSVDIVAGSLGQAIDIVASITSTDGSVSTASYSVIPTHIDLLIDSDSYTPPFYKGRALPTPGTNLHIRALTYFKKRDGSLVPPSQIVYTWKRNDQVMGKISGRGQQTVTIESPVPYSTDSIHVEAQTVDGTLHGSASVTLSSVSPILALYQDHPLFGIMYHQAMGTETPIPDSEMTFAAVPYFSQVKKTTDPQLKYTWTINDVGIEASEGRPDQILINADKSQGKAAIGLSVTHTQNFLMNLKGLWNVTFRAMIEPENAFTNAFF